MENVLGNGVCVCDAEEILYSCKCNKIQIDGREVNTFGIDAVCQNKRVDCVIDVCSDAELVEELCIKMNALKLSLVHFKEVVYDFVVSLSL